MLDDDSLQASASATPDYQGYLSDQPELSEYRHALTLLHNAVAGVWLDFPLPWREKGERQSDRLAPPGAGHRNAHSNRADREYPEAPLVDQSRRDHRRHGPGVGPSL